LKNKITKIQQNNEKLNTITTKIKQLFLSNNIFNPKFTNIYSKWNKYKRIVKINLTHLIENEQQI
jgi:hypothetical protein